jgi:DNA-binding LytR/AlgR family response regulator
MNTVLLIEDDLIEQVRVKAMLEEFGYTQIWVASSLKQARMALQKTSPSLVIADIFLQDETSLDMLTDMQQLAIPAIFITVSTDEKLYRQIDDGQSSYGYLVKPFDKLTLFSTLRLILTNKTLTAKQSSDFMMVRTPKGQKRIMLHDVLWLESSGNYTLVVTASEKFAVKQSLRRLAETMGDSFMRVHKRYCVNVAKMTHLKAHSLIINAQEIPVSYMRKTALLEKLNEPSNV